MKYIVVIVKSPGNFGAYVPDLPGSVATGRTAREVEREIKEAIEFHLDGMVEDGAPIPDASSYAVEMDVAPHKADVQNAG